MSYLIKPTEHRLSCLFQKLQLVYGLVEKVGDVVDFVLDFAVLRHFLAVVAHVVAQAHHVSQWVIAVAVSEHRWVRLNDCFVGALN